VAVFARPPVPGQAKTRLIGELTPQQAADLHQACLQDTLRLAESVKDVQRWLFLAPGKARPASRGFLRWRARGWQIRRQRGANLGARLANGCRQVFAHGASRLVIIGTDSPWMGAERIREAIAALEKRDVVLGPAEDGGYYLLGVRKFLPRMFRGIDWGTSRVLRQTLERLKASGASVALLQRDFDLDRAEDIYRLLSWREFWRRPPGRVQRLLKKWRQQGKLQAKG
jgi:rSAM/selenodomain-associated transferase 1